MRRRRLMVALGVVAALVLLVGLNTLGQTTGVIVPKQTPAERSALLSPEYRLVVPDAPPPYPALLLFSGCDGPRDNMDRWAAMAGELGWASLIVDSHGPRGLDDLEAWRLVCAGQVLSGQVRAGDVAVALADLRGMPQIDPSRIVLLGASHGGWSVLEFLGFLSGNSPPPGLTEWPGGSAAAAAAGVKGAILLYPYCGAGSRVARRGWEIAVPMLMMLARDDAVTGDDPCRALAERMKGRGHAVTEVTFDGVTHGFDQQDRAAFSTLVFDPAATAQALDLGRAFLKAAGG